MAERFYNSEQEMRDHWNDQDVVAGDRLRWPVEDPYYTKGEVDGKLGGVMRLKNPVALPVIIPSDVGITLPSIANASIGLVGSTFMENTSSKVLGSRGIYQIAYNSGNVSLFTTTNLCTFDVNYGTSLKFPLISNYFLLLTDSGDGTYQYTSIPSVTPVIVLSSSGKISVRPSMDYILYFHTALAFSFDF